MAGIMVYQESRADRSWTDMLLSVLQAMGPVLEDDKRDGKTTADSRREDDPDMGCTNPDCLVHNGPPIGPQNGWGSGEPPEA